MKQSEDQTIFAWQMRPDSTRIVCGPLATSPSFFLGSSDLVPVARSRKSHLSRLPYKRS
jgi:hypothetical protein